MNKVIEEYLGIPEETEEIELKRIKDEKEKNIVSKITHSIVAFANTNGGKIIIGIDDPEKTTETGYDRIYGIEEDKEKYDEIFQELRRVTPNIHITTSEYFIEDLDKTIAVISVPKATESLYSVGTKSYIRLKKGNKLLSPQEYADLSYARGFLKADRELVSDVDFELLDTEYYHRWRINRSLDNKPIRQILFSMGLARKEKGKILPTRAAVMLFAEHPTKLMDTKCAIKIIKYSGSIEKYGEVPNIVGVPKIIDAPIIEQIRQAQEYVLNLLSSGVEIHSGFITKYLIPERTIKEAITNAVIHRDYNMKRDIEIKIFEDRVEVISPGLLPYNINKRNIGRERALGYRNDLTVKTLREFPAPPNLDQNEGVIAMRSEMKAKGLYPPVFMTYPDTSDSILKVVLFNEHTPSEWEKVKEYLEKNKYINNSQARELTGVVQIHTMSRLLGRWCKQGLILRVNPTGNPNSVKYKLAG